jgi:uncharacterized repeat protein (TIGR03806 family)
MKRIKIKCLFLIGFLFFLTACSKSSDDNLYLDVPIQTPVVDLTQVPYPKLSDYHFFDGELKNLTPSKGVVPYKPISELFTDYAEKKRFIWLPSDTKASYNSDEAILNLPIGAAIIKLFYYNNVQPNNDTKIIETRVMIKKTTGWIFAEYIWNSEQTDAFLTTQSTTREISWKRNNFIRTINYKTPSISDCNRCHGEIVTLNKYPIGIKPQNLNSSFNYSDGIKNQLEKLIEVGYLDNNLPPTITTVVDYNDVTKSLNLRVRSYFDANCSHCHIDGGEADHQDLRFAFNQTIDPLKMGVGLSAEHFVPSYNGRIVQPNSISQSILHYRVNTNTDTFYIMPPLGRSVTHTEGVQLIEDWINSL